MKSAFKFFAASAAAALSLLSCNKEPVATIDIDASVPASAVAGTEVTVNDYTLNVKSRTWTFEDGTPATSTAPEVKVVFSSGGSKKVTLSVEGQNGATCTKDFEIVVSAPLKTDITVDKTTAMGCIRIGETVKFSLANAVGSPDKYEWTFEGGSPATSKEASPSVTFATRDRSMQVSCTIKRSSDNAEYTVTENYIVGLYPINKTYEDMDYDNISYEGQLFTPWNCYNGKDFSNIYSVAEGGANGTAHSLKIDVNQINAQAGEGEKWADCFPRDAWGCNASKLEAGKKYQLSFWMQANATEYPAYGAGCLQIISWLDTWMYDRSLDKTAEKGFNEVFGIPYSSINKNLYEVWWLEDLQLLDNSWTHVAVDFTPAEDVFNVYPYIRVYGDQGFDALYVDEVEICLVED